MKNVETVNRDGPSNGYVQVSGVVAASQDQSESVIVISATFTADPLVQPLKFWMRTLEIPAAVTMAPYAQVMQELLSPHSAFSRNVAGWNILLLRQEDWIRDRQEQSEADNLLHLRRAADEFMVAVERFNRKTSAPLFVFVCPVSSKLPPMMHQVVEEMQRQIMIRLGTLRRVHYWDHAELSRLYPLEVFEDPLADRVGHVPYTEEYFTAIGTLLVRRITALVKPRAKVIALDCDNTLWKGICGEDGSTGVELTPAHLALQRMLIRQYEAGVLLCLCSKNNQSDVDAVFMRPDMLLREEHLVASRVNWAPKSANLQSLAEELDLALDSFVLIDDSPMECAQVQAATPSVPTLQLPQKPEMIEHFVDHVWVFDHVGATDEARQRTEQYKQKQARSKALAEAEDLEQFLVSLELKVDVSPMQGEQLLRVAELIQRTNQFNLTGIRRRATEIEALWKAGDLNLLVVHVRDRFGDYGLVGGLLFQERPLELSVDTFVLSCRALGRGVEHRMINELGRIAVDSGIAFVELSYRKTARNAPALQFLEQSFAQFRWPSDTAGAEQTLFRVPAEYARGLGSNHAEAKQASAEGLQSAPSPPRAAAAKWHEAAYRLSRLNDIVPQVRRYASRGERSTTEGLVMPRSSTEAALARIFEEVLGLDLVGARDDFFEIGGDSLLAVRAISRIGSVLGLELPLHELFEGPTVEQLAARLTCASQAAQPIRKRDITEAVPLARSQQRLLFIDQLEGGSEAYHIPVLFRLSGDLDLVALRAALDALVQRHQALRTNFLTVDGEAVQEIVEQRTFALKTLDLSSLRHDMREAEWMSAAYEELAAPFNLRNGDLIRGRLVRLSRAEHCLVITMHHMISDGWSVGVFVRELAALYGAFHKQVGIPLPSLPIQYADYVLWQHEWLRGAELREQVEYWKRHLYGAPDLLELPYDRARPLRQSYRGASVPVNFSTELTVSLKALSRQHGVTLAMTLLTAWTAVLARLSGQADIVVGLPVANRPRTELEGLIGFFVNTLAVRLSLAGDPLVPDLLAHVKETMLEAYAHQAAPFENVVEALQPTRSLSHSPIFQVLFVLHNTPQTSTDVSGMTWVQQALLPRTAQFDLSLSLQESANGIDGYLNYATDLFDASTIERWVGYLKSVASALASQTDQHLGALPLMGSHERLQILESFQGTQTPHLGERLIQEIFEEQVRRAPDALAVIHEGLSLTYAQLNARANQLAHLLLKRGVRPDRRVALYVDRGVEMVIGLLGIWKAGGAYVPLDPSYPPERLAHMLADAAPLAVLTQGRWRGGLPKSAADVIVLDGSDEEISSQSTRNPDPTALGVRCDDLAYVIYTSGSTGQPKGVMVEQRHLLNLWRGLEQIYGKADLCRRVALNASFNFDASVQQFLQLLSGRALFILPQDCRRDASMLLNFVREHHINAIDCTPSQLKSWLSVGLLDSHEGSLRTVLVGGEAIDPLLWDSLKEASKIEFYNVYGPTECTVDATAALINGDQKAAHIGRPMLNRRVYVLDAAGHPAPIAVPGEIYIGGAGIGRGYLNKPALTAERFLSDPYASDPNARIYKTGDLGRWLPNGTIEYLGRNDQQVKVRGFRIELGEITAQLRMCAQVYEAAVVVREDLPGERRLVAYVVGHSREDSGAAVSAEGLRMRLKGVLPEYMVPSAFVILERLPLTPNGKLDQRALPAPDLSAYASRRYEAPQGDVEETLARIWQGLLNVERIGGQDNFFELGGHSLLIMQMLEGLRRAGLSTEVRRVFEAPTLSSLASALTRGAVAQFEVPPNWIPAECQLITPQMLPLVALESQHIKRIAQAAPGGMANIQDIYPLAPLQEGILFHHLLSDQGGDAYVAPTLLLVSSRSRLDALVAALQAVIDRHDVLRTAVLWEQLPRPVQVVYRRAVLPVTEIALNPALDGLAQARQWLSPAKQRMNLQQAPLMSLQIAADVHSGSWFVLLLQHHIVSDNVSQEIVFSELLAQLEGSVQRLGDAIPYRDHVAQSLAYARTHDAETFFRSKLGDVHEPTAPFGLLDVHGDGSHLEEARRELEPILAERVRAQARRHGVSAATLFHSAWGLVVARTSGRDDVVFGSVLLGRLQGGAGVQRTLGMFINTLPLRLQLAGLTAKSLVEHTQRELIGLLSHEQASLAVAQRCSGINGAVPLFSSLLNYRHNARIPDFDWIRADGIRVLDTYGFTNYPITLSVDDLGEGFALTAQTGQGVGPQRVVDFLDLAVRSLVGALEETPEKCALTLRLLPENERRQILERFNETQTEYPRDKLIHELFEQQVERRPDVSAVKYGTSSLTYAELNDRANQLALFLRGEGVGADQVVGLCVDRGLEMVIGLLGILKAGAAYLPLDPSYPAERLQFMLQDAAPPIVLTHENLKHTLPSTRARVISLDSKLRELMESATVSNPAPQLELTPQNLLYVIYTSGSTGRPKGISMSHGAMANLMGWHGATFHADENPQVLQFAALSFDVAFQEVFSTLCVGGTLAILDEWVRRDVGALLELLISRRIQRLFVPPLMLQSIAEYFQSRPTSNLSLTDIVTAGEQLRISPEIVRLFKRLGGCRLHNHYGPTETHVVTALTLDGDPERWPAIPSIGRPIANTRIYVLGPQQQPAPVGVIGEVYIGGANVARGYLSRPELTVQRFIADPFTTDVHDRMYKTGDLGRWHADGTIEYLGRNDDQVKIRGYRIELGEIEEQLARHAQVREAVVVVREDTAGDKRLVAYFTTRDGRLDPAEAMAHAKSTLPEHMVPGAFIELDALPLTPSGKLDRRALPAPDSTNYENRKYEAPQGEIEEMLADIWKSLLRIERVGRHDDFFDCGGHSLLAMRAAARIQSEMSIEMPMRFLFESPTVARLAARVATLYRENLLERISQSGAQMEDLLDQIATMPEGEIQELLSQFETGPGHD